MKTKFTLALFLLASLLPGQILSQQNNKIWYFGDQAGLDFSGPIPVPLTNGQLATTEGSATVTDASGALLFYSDGKTIWNKNHQVMSNGTGLLGSFTTTQSCLIEPLPGSTSLIYVFSIGDQYSAGTMNYSIVDMSLAGGLGMVTQKNVSITSNIAEKVTSARNDANTTTWIMVHDRGTNILKAFALTAAGISPTSVNSAVGDSIIDNHDTKGQIKFSPDRSKLAMAVSGRNFINLFDFDRTTGIATNARHISVPVTPEGVGAYGIEFSPSSGFLYGSTEVSGGVSQWNVTLPSESAINNSRVQIAPGHPLLPVGSLQLAPNGKIYIADYNSFSLSAINQPDLPGLACGYENNALSLGSGYSQLGLPNYVQAPDAIVPVKLISFSGQNNGSNNLLTWSTATEENNLFFSLQRRANGRDFETIARINGAGTSTQILNYSYTDHFPFNGVNQYRLLQTDNDGRTSTSKIVSIDNSSDKLSGMLVSPTIATDFIKLLFAEPQQPVVIVITNMLGEVVLKMGNTDRVGISNLNKGMYAIKVKTERALYTARFIKQ